MESFTLEQQEIDAELDRRVAWARERKSCFDRNEWHYLTEVQQRLTRAKAFVMYEIHQMLLRADNFGLRQTEGRLLNNDLPLLQMCQEFIAREIEELSRFERAEAFNPENKN